MDLTLMYILPNAEWGAGVVPFCGQRGPRHKKDFVAEYMGPDGRPTGLPPRDWLDGTSSNHSPEPEPLRDGGI